MIPNRKAHCTEWYPKKREEILPFLSSTSQSELNGPISFLVCPHAGWLYSGKVSGRAYSTLKNIDTAILIATNHTGLGPSSSLYPGGEWEMPLGNVSVDQELAKNLLQNSNTLKEDTLAHQYEHAIEVQIPFLQAINPQIKIIAIEMKDYSFSTCQNIAHSLVQSIEKLLSTKSKKRLCVIASSDMTHCGLRYGQKPPTHLSPDAFARIQDQFAIEEMTQLNSQGLLNTVKQKNITMCGSGPAAVVMETAKTLGAKKGHLLHYATSSEVTGMDSDLAVGYAGIGFF